MKQEKIQIKQSVAPSTVSQIIFWIMSVGTAIFLSVAFFYWTIVPYMQSNSYIADTRQAYQAGDFSIFLNDQFVFDPDSNVQGILRSDFLRQALSQYSNPQISKAVSGPVLDKGIAEMEEYLSNHEDYYTYIVGVANAYATKSEIENNPELYLKAEGLFKKVLTVVKNRADLYYTYALSLIKQHRVEEGLNVLKDAIAQNPDLVVLHYQLATAYIMSGEAYYQDSLNEFEYAFNNHNNNNNADFTKQAYQELLKYYYEKKDIPNFLTVINRLVTVDPAQKNAYENVIEFTKVNGNKLPNLNIGKPAGS